MQQIRVQNCTVIALVLVDLPDSVVISCVAALATTPEGNAVIVDLTQTVVLLLDVFVVYCSVLTALFVVCVVMSVSTFSAVPVSVTAVRDISPSGCSRVFSSESW